MKSNLIALPLCLALSAVAGCGAPASENASNSPNDAAIDTSSNASATIDLTLPTNTPAKTTKMAENPPTAPANKPVAGKEEKPDPRYRVVDETAGMPPEEAQAMKAVQVPPPPASMKVPSKVRVRLDTSQGPITLELNAKAAPLQVKSFVYLSQLGFYNGVTFHRYADLLGNGQGYIIQGGDPLTKNPATAQYAGGGGPGYQIPRERNALKHDKLVIAAARTQDPDSAGSQFYITQNPVYFLDEGDGYTVFGKVIGGSENALKLRQDDTIKSVTVLTKISKKK